MLGAIVRRVRERGLEIRVLNDPMRYKGRYEQLRFLYEHGINSHNAYHLTEHRLPARWPVFLRQELGHARSRLLQEAEELEAHLAAFDRHHRWRKNWLIVEVNDTQDSNGFYRKDSAFRIGDHIVPWRVLIARDWWVRRDQLDDADLLEGPALAEEELAYMRANPHADALMEIFQKIGIEFGRIDYSMKGDQIQVWEINDAPTLLKRSFFEEHQDSRPVLNLYSTRLYEAFAALDAEASSR